MGQVRPGMQASPREPNPGNALLPVQRLTTSGSANVDTGRSARPQGGDSGRQEASSQAQVHVLLKSQGFLGESPPGGPTRHCRGLQNGGPNRQLEI